jgi:ABC-type polysaccharide/polyol phosphate export permease
MLNPLTQFAVYHFVFSYLFVSKLNKFTLYLLTGVFFWNFFQDCTMSAIAAISARSRLTKKIYFPRYLIVFSSSLTAMFSFAINTATLWLVVAVSDHVSPLQILTIIPFSFLILLSVGVGFLIAIMYVHFRDVSQIWAVVLSFGFWLTPITYDALLFPGPLETVALVNPVGRILVMLRAFLVYDNLPSTFFILSTGLFSLAIFLFGWWMFRKYEHRVAEYL